MVYSPAWPAIRTVADAAVATPPVVPWVINGLLAFKAMLVSILWLL